MKRCLLSSWILAHGLSVAGCSGADPVDTESSVGPGDTEEHFSSLEEVSQTPVQAPKGPFRNPAPIVYVDAALAPDLAGWAGQQARLVILAWYSFVADRLGVVPTSAPGVYTPLPKIWIRFDPNTSNAAYVYGRNIYFNPDWVRRNPTNMGVVLHEMTHVIQSYPASVPSWVVESMASWVSTYLYRDKIYVNPTTNDHYTQGYSPGAYFLEWVRQNRASNVIEVLNVRAQNGQYSDDIFRELTGQSLPDLWNKMMSLQAGFVGQSATTLRPVAGKPFTVSFTVKNTGLTSWVDWNQAGVEGRAVRLGFVGGDAFGVPARISLNNASDVDVHPGESTTFTLNAVAPSTPGRYRTEWQLVSEMVTWYGPRLWLDFDVQVPGLDAALVGQSLSAPSTEVGAELNFSFTLKNTGTNSWVDWNAYQEGRAVRLGFVGGDSLGVPARVSVNQASNINVQPGQSTTWSLKGIAPQVPGRYRTEWQAVSEYVAWFGPRMWLDFVTYPKNAPRVGLRTLDKKLYVVAEQDGSMRVNANRTTRGPWETFVLFDTNGGSLQHGDVVAFQTINGTFLSAEGGGAGALVSGRNALGPWEKFTILKQGGTDAVIRTGDNVSIRSVSGHSLCAEGGGGGVVNATRTVAGLWETFTVEM